ncbi:MAG: hypothetical protein QOG75_789 [Mycobacterium sp.]|jgi:hypothetical protein|nr:hypothetical protein [Mycobacterium sp.]
MSSSLRRQPRTSALSGRHPAVPLASDPQPAIPPIPATSATPVTVTRPTTVTKPATLEKSSASQKMTVNVSRDLIDQAKDAFWLARGEYRTFSAWVEDALRRHIDATKAAHDVDTMPRRPGGGALPPGRPLS